MAQKPKGPTRIMSRLGACARCGIAAKCRVPPCTVWQRGVSRPAVFPDGARVCCWLDCRAVACLQHVQRQLSRLASQAAERACIIALCRMVW